LDFVEKLLDLLKVLRVILLRESFSHFLELLFKFLVKGLQVSDFRIFHFQRDIARGNMPITLFITFSEVGDCSTT
jgi:hypothetical protein